MHWGEIDAAIVAQGQVALSRIPSSNRQASEAFDFIESRMTASAFGMPLIQLPGKQRMSLAVTRYPGGEPISLAISGER
jgi:hypothetical protein